MGEWIRIEYIRRLGGVRSYLLHQLFDLGSKRVIFALGSGGGGKVQVELLLGNSGDVGMQIIEVGGGLEVNLAMVKLHNAERRSAAC